MKIKVLRVNKQKGEERVSFQFVNEAGNSGLCRPSPRFAQNHPSFTVKQGDDLIVDHFIPDVITGQVMPILIPESIRRVIAQHC
jgi:hypothetical protein